METDKKQRVLDSYDVLRGDIEEILEFAYKEGEDIVIPNDLLANFIAKWKENSRYGYGRY